MATEVVLLGGARTPFGSFGGSLKDLSAIDLFCAIGGKRVWLPREHISGRLWSRGDCGTLSVRSWIAVDRHLDLAQAPKRRRRWLHVMPKQHQAPLGN